ncbi:HDIG domain-containing protein [Desulfotomaculum arcticum]|uniref:HDIG domain-containing protein n=2 Tax=Desulfotruncus TaxID=2867377 RepID=A0A1I2QD97_9FIRM|nr:HDIG domain-containing protein [Desulfotomaculum arcticum] [Desulfotruncus arcticus DSM 17038]
MKFDGLRNLIIKASPCGVLVVDTNGVIVGCNDILSKHRLIRHQNIINRHVKHVFYQDLESEDSYSLDPIMETLHSGRDVVTELTLRSNSTELVICRVWTTILKDTTGKIIGACGVFHDLTPYRKKKKQLEEINRVLMETGNQLIQQHMETMRAFANAIAARDNCTRWHSEKVAEYAQQICINMGTDNETANVAYLAGLLHDVGKIGVPEEILTKPGKLTEQEYEVIKTHPIIGVNILESMKNMKEILQVIKHHHERYDGGGYPSKLKGNKIPLLSRVLAVADSFDAMTSDRSYRKAFPLEKAIEEIKSNSGTQFDPRVVNSFMHMVQEQYLQ